MEPWDGTVASQSAGKQEMRMEYDVLFLVTLYNTSLG